MAGMAGRDVVVDFMASWCVPCRQELPQLAKVSQSMSERVTFVGVDSNDTLSGIQGLLRSSGVRFPVGSDPHGVIARTYHLLGLPGLFLVSPSGKVLGETEGEVTGNGLRRWITNLEGQ